MTSKPIIAVTGATGAQGGSVVKFLQKDGSFAIRAITRNTNSDKAKALAAQGVEVVSADFNKVETVEAAFRGVYGVYGVTNYWEPGVREKEIQLGKTLIDAAKKEGVKHFIWSTLDRTANPAVDHFNTKVAIDDYLKASGVPRTSLYTSFYYENFLAWFPIKKTESGQFEANWPILASDGVLPCFAVVDTGAFVVQALKNPTEWIGKDMGVIADTVTPRTFVKTVEELSGKKINLIEVSDEKFETSRSALPGMEEFWDNMKWFYLQKGFPPRDSELTKRLYPERYDLRSWVKENISGVLPH